jgi:glycine cleavage system H protein
VNIPSDLKYSLNDEWIKQDGTVGITDFAQEQLSDIVFVEVIVSAGDPVKKGDACATVESVKAAAEVYAPVSGKVIEVNESLSDNPELINKDPYGQAWMLKIEPSDPREMGSLMDASAYQKHTEEKK